MSKREPVRYTRDDSVVTVTLDRGEQECPVGRGDECLDGRVGGGRGGSAGQGGYPHLSGLRGILRGNKPQAAGRNQGARWRRYSDVDAGSDADRDAQGVKADHRSDDGIADGGVHVIGHQVRYEGWPSRDARRHHRGQDGARFTVGRAMLWMLPQPLVMELVLTGVTLPIERLTGHGFLIILKIRLMRSARGRFNWHAESSKARRYPSRRPMPACSRRWIWVARTGWSRPTGCTWKPMPGSML